MFLLDTNIVSEIVKRSPHAKVLARLNREDPVGLHISSVTVFELRFGAARSAKPASLWARIQRDILALVRSVQRTPSRFAIRFADIRRANLTRFPYAVWFLHCADAVYILAVLHHKWDHRAILKQRRAGV